MSVPQQLASQSIVYCKAGNDPWWPAKVTPSPLRSLMCNVGLADSSTALPSTATLHSNIFDYSSCLSEPQNVVPFANFNSQSHTATELRQSVLRRAIRLASEAYKGCGRSKLVHSGLAVTVENSNSTDIPSLKNDQASNGFESITKEQSSNSSGIKLSEKRTSCQSLETNFELDLPVYAHHPPDKEHQNAQQKRSDDHQASRLERITKQKTIEGLLAKYQLDFIPIPHRFVHPPSMKPCKIKKAPKPACPFPKKLFICKIDRLLRQSFVIEHRRLSESIMAKIDLCSSQSAASRESLCVSVLHNYRKRKDGLYQMTYSQQCTALTQSLI